MTLRELIRLNSDILKKADIASANLDVRVLIKHVLNLDDVDLTKKSDELVSTDKTAEIDKLVLRRAKGEPIAYLTGHKEFYGLDFLVNCDVLIPRPESEWLVEKGTEFIKLQVRQVHQVEKMNIIDLGTGSGCIILSIINSLSLLDKPDKLSTACPELVEGINFLASDISPTALAIAQKNAKLHKIDHINFIQSDLFTSIDKTIKFDLIIANLPYVPLPVCHSGPVEDRIRNLAIDSISFEPNIAIFASDNGAEIIKRFLVEAKNRLTPNGQILIELDPRNADDIRDFALKIFPQKNIKLEKDLANFDRYLIIN